MRVHLPPDLNGTDHHAVAPHQIIQRGDVHPRDVVIGLTADWHWWCTVQVELAGSPMYRAAQDGGVAAAMQADHALLVSAVQSFMSAHGVTRAALANEIGRPKAAIRGWLKSTQSPEVEKEYDQLLWQMLPMSNAHLAKKEAGANPPGSGQETTTHRADLNKSLSGSDDDIAVDYEHSDEADASPARETATEETGAQTAAKRDAATQENGVEGPH